ncbi:translational GTPase TypA [Candidatus Marinamargulisbacteria bacterium SCGC AG-439-L15]|nr:translational GTPase TypA [Candidatus Marinamargulisbacteria bacterium SCGC AG-439-L15]
MINQDKIRNIAIIAHVDHGKTTIVDQLFKQSGLFRENQEVSERLMDSIDLEKERGITIASKNGGFNYKDHLINIIDTPGHADFGGQVERVLCMADAAVLLVDAAEGPMPQTYFVLKKALARDLPILVVINKIDKPAARCDWVMDQVFDVLVQLEAPDETLDFPVIYASARDGISKHELEDDNDNMIPLLDKIIEFVPPPKGDPNGPPQVLVSSLSYSSFFGRMATGKLTNGSLKPNQDVVVSKLNGDLVKGRITKLYRFTSNEQIETDFAQCGDIVAIGGLTDITVGETITDPTNPMPLPAMEYDPPTLAMTFMANDSPFSGKEGEFVTSNQLSDRLHHETLSDTALKVENLDGDIGFKVSGRGELHLSILIERLRREGYEFQVSRPQVIIKEENGIKTEPYEELTIEVSEEHQGKVIEALGTRKGELKNMEQDKGLVTLTYKIPTRGLLGFRSEFMTATKGMGIMNYIFDCYDAYVGPIKTRKNGVLVSKETCTTIAFALFNLQDRGKLFLGPGVDVYEGQIVGENAREDDIVVNPAKGKKLTNMRASGSDDTVKLVPHTELSLEQCISYITDTELLECTPKAIRMRKKLLSEGDRKRAKQL